MVGALFVLAASVVALLARNARQTSPAEHEAAAVPITGVT
jgi:hypothetical protein